MKKLSKRKKKWIERTVANDRSNKRFLYNRFYLFALLVLLQIVVFCYNMYLLVYKSRIGVLLQAALVIVGVCSVIYILNKDDRPSTKLNWVLLILTFPVFGVPFYLVCGEGGPTRKMRKKLESSKAENDRRAQEILGEIPLPVPQNRGEGISRYLTERAGYPTYLDGSVTYYKTGEEMFPVMLQELQKAKKFILIEYFIIAHGKMWGEVLKILLQKAEEGTKIRIIYDDFGCMTTLPPDYDKYLESLHENIRAISFNPIVPVFTLRMNNRDHRKILVIDGKVGFTGGVNLADEYINEKRRFGYWKDTGVRVTGNAVNSFTKMFFSTWNAFRKDKEDIGEYLSVSEGEEGEGVIQPFDDSPLDGKSVGESVYMDIINRAVKYLYIFTPYLLLDDAVRLSLVRAAERGVDVRIITPAVPDKKMVFRMTRANYPPLQAAGVKIYEYTPGFIHAKSVVCDDECAVVGSINFDYRSLYFHFEDGVYFTGNSAVMDVKRDAEETIALSKFCEPSKKRRVFGRLFDSFLRLFEGLM